MSVHLRFSGVTLALFRRSAGEEFSRWLKKFPALACLCAVLLFCGWPFNTHGELTGELGAFQDQCLVLMKRGNPPEAVSVAEKFVARAIELHGENHDATATAIGWVAYFSQLSADLERSEQLWRRALAIDEKLHGKDALETTSRLNMLAGLYQQKGDFIRAEEFLLRALKIREQHLDKNDPLLANTLWGLGRLANACGNFSKAEQYLTRAAVIYEKAVETDAHVALYATAGLNSLTGVYLDIGDLEKAEDYANRAVRIGEKNPAGALGPLSASYRLLGEISWKRGDIFQAERWLRKGLESYETLVGTNLDGEIQTRRLELGQFYLEQGNLEQAETVMRPVLSTAAENLPGNRDQKWSVLQCLAAWYEQQGEYDQAKTLARQNFDLVKDLAQIAPDVYSGPLKNLAEIELGLGNPNGAVAFANQIQDAEERKLGEVFSFSNERQRLSYQARGSDKGLDLWARAGAVQPLCRAVLRRKGLVLDSLLEDRRSVEKSDDPRARELLEQVRIARERVTGLQTALTHDSVHTNLVAYWARELEKAHSEAEVAENELARRVTGLGRVRRALKVTVEEIQQAIPQAAVVVELFRYRHYQGKSVWLDSYGALVLPHSGEPRFVPLGAAEPIEQNIKRYHYSMREEGGNESLQAVLESLSQQLWAPLRKALPPGTRSVIISPDGELNFVSFAALLTEDRAFVGEKFLISYVATARDLLPTRETRSTKKDLLVWANPDFGAAVQTEPASTNWLVSSRAASARAFRDLTFRPLTGAEQEGRRLQAHAADFGFQRVELHLGKDATEAELRRVDSPRVLHLATHGFFLPEIENPRRQNNFLPDARFVAGSSSLVNPMLRSGLALAGAQTTLAAWKNGELVPAGDDGIVTAEEISRLNLRDTWLVVLSACDTGMGEARSGEGVLGLRRGFIQAGAQNLLLTLWPIDDQKTVGFIGDFYRTATHTSDAPRALAEVQRGWLHRLRKAKGIAEAAKTAGPFILSFQRGQ